MPALMDESVIFKLNSKREKTVEKIEIGGSEPLKIIRIHNIYENPEAVRDVFLSSPHTLTPMSTGGSPWWRARFVADLRAVYGELISIIKTELNPGFKPPYKTISTPKIRLNDKGTISRIELNRLADYSSRAIDNYIEGCPAKHIEKFLEWHKKREDYNDAQFTRRTWSIPHADPDYYGCSIWLNDQDTCQGGTGFYRHIETGATSLEELQKLFIEKDQHYMNEIISTFHNGDIKPADRKLISDSNNMWELKHIEKMEFNTAVLYNGNFFHAAYLKEDMFKEHYRLSQVFFILDEVKRKNVSYPKAAHILSRVCNKDEVITNDSKFDENHAFTYTR
jgi:hypothetical protein